ncbi:hypothetical protein MRX96_018254 [Rhipicephalus microplus]
MYTASVSGLRKGDKAIRRLGETHPNLIGEPTSACLVTSSELLACYNPLPAAALSCLTSAAHDYTSLYIAQARHCPVALCASDVELRQF